MKQLFPLFLILFFVGCNNSIEPNSEILDPNLIGIWNFISQTTTIVYNENETINQWLASEGNSGIFIFSEDGNCMKNSNYGGTITTSTGTFSTSENILELLLDESASSLWTYSISENIFIYTHIYDGGFGNIQTTTYTYEKSNDNVYVYNAYLALAKKCYEINNNQSLFSFEKSQYSFSSDNSCIEYCTDYLNDIQSSNYSCYDCSLPDPILYKKNNDGNIYPDSTLNIETLSAYCQITMPD